MNSYYY